MSAHGWAEMSLTDVLVLQRGYDLPAGQRGEGQVPVIGSFGITGYHSAAKGSGPGVAIGRSGASIGKATYVDGDYWPLNTCLYVSDFKGNDPRWAYRFLDLTDFSAYNSGSAQPSLNRNFLARIPVLVPPLPQQRAIAEVLGALDDKIAVNEHLVAVSERLLLARVSQAPSEVPVSEVAGHERRSVSPSTMGDQLLSHYSLPAFDEHHVPVVEPASKILSGKFAVTAPCVLMSKLNPRFPRVWDLPVVAESAVASTEFVVLTPRGVSTSALWAALSQPRLGQELEDRAAGTSGSHQRVRPQEILSSKIPDPRSLAEGERTLIANLGRRVFEARVESQKLGALRDALLPELMSGRLTVKDAESQVEEVV